MRVKTHIHWKNLGKVFLLFFLLGIALLLLFTKFEIPPDVAAFIGVVVGGGTAVAGANRWLLWHFEVID